MSTRTIIRCELSVLLALGLFLLNAACPGSQMGTILQSPSLENQQQIGAATVNDGTTDDVDTGATTTGAVSSEILAEATLAGHAAKMEVEVDHDSFGVTCEHDHAGGPVESSCFGLVEGSFPVDTLNQGAGFDVAFFAFSPDTGNPALTQQVDVSIDIECGGTTVPTDLDSGGLQQLTVTVDVDPGATECKLVVSVDDLRVTSTGLLTNVTQGVRVTATNIAPIACLSSNECPPEMDRCSPQLTCTTGTEGQPGTIPSLHCNTLFSDEFGTCSDGDAGSFARGAFECAPGYSFDLFECKGEPCNGASDCTDPARPICTDRGCSATGLRGDGCHQGFGCASGLCLNNFCQEIVGQGADCSDPFVICDVAFRCFATLTCQVPLPLGSTCAANQECQGFPVLNSCIFDECQAKGPLCDDQQDCALGKTCDFTGGGFCI